MYSDLPQELIDHIVDYVHDDRRTLATLRLLNNAWNNSASLHFYRKVEFDFSEPKCTSSDVFKALLSLLESSTETISHCVRKVVLIECSRIATECQDDVAVLLPFIVSRFTHISDIEFQDTHWYALTPSFSSCILRICKSPTIERIDFWRCSMPILSTFLDILQASSNLKTLYLIELIIGNLPGSKQHHPTPSSSTENQYCTNSTAPLLRSLTVCGASDHLLHVFKVNLKQLHWILSRDNISAKDVFLKGVGQSLESLAINFTPLIIDLEEPGSLRLDLSHCPRLQHLCISRLPWSLSLCPSTYFCLLFDQTSVPDQSPPIECLELKVEALMPGFIRCTDEKIFSESAGLRPDIYQHQCLHQCQHNNDSNVRYHRGKLCHSGWLTFDDSLCRSPIFQSLKMLKISVEQFGEPVVDLSSLSDTFPKLKNKGVEVRFTD